MRRYLAPRWLLGHVVVAAVAVTCLRLGWWQWEHARQGNTLSYGYALQWPLFAGFGVFFWTRIVDDRMRPRTPAPAAGGGSPDRTCAPASARGDSTLPVAGPVWSFRPDLIPPVLAAETPPTSAATDHDDEVAAYNELLAWLNADPNRRLADYRRAIRGARPSA